MVQKMYRLIYYTSQMHLHVVSLPLIPSSRSPSFCRVGGSTGHQAMSHQYARW